MSCARDVGILSVDRSLDLTGVTRRRRRSSLSAVLALILVGGAGAADALPGTAHLKWSGTVSQRTLDDGSLLNEYESRTLAADETDVTLSVGFVPRFGCSPLIGIRLDAALANRIDEAAEGRSGVLLVIDGRGAPMPFVADADGAATTLWLDEAAPGREQFRRLIDSGSRAELTLPGGESVTFSLLGSRRSLAGTEAACLAHEPVPFPD